MKVKLFVPENLTIHETMKAINKNGYGMAIVTGTSGKLKGIATDGDIRRAILHGSDVDEKISSIMTRDPLVLPAGRNHADIKKFIEQHRESVKGAVTKVPVLNRQGKVIDLLFFYENGYSFLKHGRSKTKGAKKLVKHVLVVGGAGFIGSILVRMLLSAGYCVTVLDLFLYGNQSLKDLKSNKMLTVIKGDTRHIEDITRALDGIDAVVHLAELVGDPACAHNPKMTQEINYFATRQLASMCRHLQISRLVYFSSCSVYGISEDGACAETSPLNPVSLYAKTKVTAERALLEFADDVFKPTILRLATVYGASFRPRFDLVVNTLTAKAIVNKEITIFGGDQWRPLVHVKDVCRAVMRVLEAPSEKVGGEIFNVGSSEQNYTILGIGKKIKRLIPGAQLKISSSDTDRRNYNVDFSKIRRSLGYKTLYKVEDGIREVMHLINSGAVKDYTNVQYSNIQTLQQKI